MHVLTNGCHARTHVSQPRTNCRSASCEWGSPAAVCGGTPWAQRSLKA
jgi:hypothetical protein